jgi:hypothetical protein
VTRITDPEATYLGLDVHKDSISVGILEPGVDSQQWTRSFMTSRRCGG